MVRLLTRSVFRGLHSPQEGDSPAEENRPPGRTKRARHGEEGCDMGLWLNLRTRVQPFKAVDDWEEVFLLREFAPERTALLLCDVWDTHHCKSAARRCDALAPKINETAEALRARGVFVVHAPSD